MNTHSKQIYRKLKSNNKYLCKTNRTVFSDKESISLSLGKIHDFIQGAKDKRIFPKSFIINSKTI